MLSEDEIDEYEEQAMDWSVNAPPNHIRARYIIPCLSNLFPINLPLQNGYRRNQGPHRPRLPDPAL